MTDPSTQTTHTYYDAAGNVTGTTDGLGHLTTSVYDDAGRVVETIDPNNHVTGRLYDAAGNLTFPGQEPVDPGRSAFNSVRGSFLTSPV